MIDLNGRKILAVHVDVLPRVDLVCILWLYGIVF